jgi:hypothetical protein
MSAALCGCGCGRMPEADRTYFNNACRQRAYRQRKRADAPRTPKCPARGLCKRHNRYNRPPRPVKPETTGGGGKRLKHWDSDHVGRPGSWDDYWRIQAQSTPLTCPDFERSSDWAPLRGIDKHARRGIPRDRWLELDGNKIDHTPGPPDDYIYGLRKGGGAAMWGERPLRVRAATATTSTERQPDWRLVYAQRVARGELTIEGARRKIAAIERDRAKGPRQPEPAVRAVPDPVPDVVSETVSLDELRELELDELEEAA